MQAPIQITFSFQTPQDAAAFMAAAAGTGGVPASPAPVQPAAAPSQPAPPAAPANPTPAAQPMPGTTAAPVPGAASPSNAVPSATASPSNGVQHTVQTVQPVMVEFGKKFGPPLLKQAFANKQLPAALSQLDANGLAVMHDYLSRCITANQLLPA